MPGTVQVARRGASPASWSPSLESRSWIREGGEFLPQTQTGWVALLWSHSVGHFEPLLECSEGHLRTFKGGTC
jgi:hypothetical protein